MTPLASSYSLQPRPDHYQARKGRGSGRGSPAQVCSPGLGVCGGVPLGQGPPAPSLLPAARPGSQPNRAEHIGQGAPRQPQRGAPVPEPASPTPGPQRPGRPARPPSGPGPQPSPRPNCLPRSSPPAPEGRRTWAAASSLPSKVKSSKSGLRQRL